MTTARHLVVSGRVQGVDFRAWVRDRARAEGVTGWAANQADGSVEIRLQGPANAVAAVEHAVSDGPSHARVDRVEAADAAVLDGVEGFERR